MRLTEIIYQGLLGAASPVKIELPHEVSIVELPTGVSGEDIANLLISALYPQRTPHNLRMSFVTAPDARLALTLLHNGRRYRVLRCAEMHSLRLQVEESEGFRDIAQGAARTETLLRQSLQMPSFEVFWLLNLRRWDQSPSSADAFEMETLDPNLRGLIEKYRLSRKVEGVEDAIKETEGKLSDCRRELGQGAALEEKLKRGLEMLNDLEVAGLTAEETELLREKDARLAEFEHQLNRLRNDEDNKRQQVEISMPGSIWRNPGFLAALFIGVASIVYSLIQGADYRFMVVVDIASLSIAAILWLNYYTALSRASAHQVGLDSIKRRINQVREEQVAYQERISHLLVHAGVRDEKELTERIGKAERLKDMLEKLEEQVAQLMNDPEYENARREHDRLQDKLAALKEERESLPSDVMSAFQLETDLESMGIDPRAVLEDEASSSDDEEPIQRLLAAARQVKLGTESELDEHVTRMWSRIAGHILGERFQNVTISDGELSIDPLTADQVQMWASTRISELALLLDSLALAIVVIAVDRSKMGAFEGLIFDQLEQRASEDQARRFMEVFKSAAKKAPVVLLKES